MFRIKREKVTVVLNRLIWDASTNVYDIHILFFNFLAG